MSNVPAIIAWVIEREAGILFSLDWLRALCSDVITESCEHFGVVVVLFVYLCLEFFIAMSFKACSSFIIFPTVLCGNISFGPILCSMVHFLMRTGITEIIVLVFLLQSVNFHLLLKWWIFTWYAWIHLVCILSI